MLKFKVVFKTDENKKTHPIVKTKHNNELLVGCVHVKVKEMTQQGTYVGCVCFNVGNGFQNR